MMMQQVGWAHLAHRIFPGTLTDPRRAWPERVEPNGFPQGLR